MPVIVRETRIIGGKETPNIKVYKTNRPLTKKLREQADDLDLFLHKTMAKIINEMKKQGLLKKKGKSGVLELWYQVGKQLDFVMDPSIVPGEDRKFVWRALYDHAGPLHNGPIPVRVERSPLTSHFRYCYLIASQFDWEFVKSAGNWTAWVEFLDSPVIHSDKRIIEWLGSKQSDIIGTKQEWVRELAKAIRRKFDNKITSVFDDDELYQQLDEMYDKIVSKKE